MKRALLVLMLMVVMGSASAQTKTPVIPNSPTLAQVGRYQLLAVETDDGLAKEKTVFLLDTVTGTVWKYQPPFTTTDSNGKKVPQEPLFIYVRALPDPSSVR